MSILLSLVYNDDDDAMFFGNSQKVKNLHPVTEEFESGQYFGALEPKDTEWAAINSNFVAETQTFYSILQDGQCLSVQVVYSHVGLVI